MKQPMPVSRLRLTFLTAIAFCAASPWALAQTTINLNTANGTCVAVIADPAGLTLDTTPGSTTLVGNDVTLTASQPGACNPAGGGGGLPAPTPNPIPLTAPASAQSGVLFAVTWPQMANATQCVGSGTLNGANAPTLGDWTTLTTVSTSGTNTRNVLVPSSSNTSTLVLTLTCWNADNSASATGQTGSIAVAAAPVGTCPTTITMPNGTRTLLTRSNISYGVYPAQRPNVDVSQWDNIWGHNSTTDTGTPWPGVGGASPVLGSFARASYIGAHFRTTSDTTRLGHFSNPSFVAGPNVTMAISTQCGDFSAHLPTPGCIATDVPPSDANLVSWKLTPNNPTGSCNLQPNTDYYVNMTFTDPAAIVNGCPSGATTCFIGAVSYHN